MERIVEVIKRPVMPPVPVVRQRVAAYARVSSGKDAMLHSLSAQVSYYNNYIQKRPDWAFAGIFADEAVTGTKDNRDAFQQMLLACEKGQIDRIITKSITRFARNTVDLLNTVRKLKALSIDVYFEEEHVHTLSEEGELLLTVMASHAQEQSRAVSSNCKWRIRKNFSMGKASFCRIYGYKVQHGEYRIIPNEAEIIRMIYQDYLSGMGPNAIRRKLISLNSPTKNGGKWTDGAINNILSNEKYIGDLLLQKSYVSDHLSKLQKPNKGELAQYYVRNHHPAIIGREMFAAVQAEKKQRTALYSTAFTEQKTYPFSSLITCSICGAHYMHKMASSGPKYIRPVWICGTYNRLGKNHCQAQQIPEDILIEVTNQVLGIPCFDVDTFKKHIEKIVIPQPFTLEFHMRNEQIITKTWVHSSRKWNENQKSLARSRYQDRLEKEEMS